MSAILNTGNDPARCIQHNALDCPCSDPPRLTLITGWGPIGPVDVVEVYETPTGRREETRKGLTVRDAKAHLRAVWSNRDDTDESAVGAYAMDADGTRWRLPEWEWVADEPEIGGCGCGRADVCWLCGSPPPEAA